MAFAGILAEIRQTPRAVTAAPPSEVTSPPPVAVVWVIAEIFEVDTDGNEGDVVNVTSSPYDVPTLFVA